VADPHPVLKRALLNQYQILLAAGATALSVAMMSPLPWLLLLGGNLITMPFLFERFRKRMEIEKKYAERKSEELSQEQRYEELAAESKGRFQQFRRLCSQIQNNYRGLSSASQDILHEQTSKFDAILASCLRRLWLVQKYESMIRTFDARRVENEIKQLEGALQAKDVQPRVREAWQQNLDIKRKLLETAERNESSRTAVLAELDSLESLLQLLMQKSVAATDPSDFVAQVDDIVSQAEADAQSVAEMEALMGSMPELTGAPALSDRLRQAPPVSAPPAPPPPVRRERR
jgi:hypothetical protein